MSSVSQSPLYNGGGGGGGGGGNSGDMSNFFSEVSFGVRTYEYWLMDTQDIGYTR
jgi:hypothetical protein